MNSISIDQLERYERIAVDTKKFFSYDKLAGTWAWFEAGEDETPAVWRKNYPTRLEALLEAIEPYLLELEHEDDATPDVFAEPPEEAESDGDDIDDTSDEHDASEDDKS